MRPNKTYDGNAIGNIIIGGTRINIAQFGHVELKNLGCATPGWPSASDYSEH